MQSKKLIAVLVSVMMISCANANLLSNGDFEEGDTGGINSIPGWYNWGGSGWHHNDGPLLDSKGLKFWWDDAGIWQDFGATAGLEYTFGVEVYNRASAPCGWNGLMRVEFYDASDTKIYDAQLDRFYSGSDPYDTWVTIGGAVAAPENTTSGRIILQIADWYSGISGDLFFDNASVVVPEPMTMAIFGLGLLLIKRKK
ncbi:MAG: hypothetical protein A2Y10_07260 [Planctomycetes bacterium GWF2_41_51]|nr:MAG: hypothetical protein A2Y10_07260 [Planctomycetes bacterium GWF2_41_51]HBG27886.1 hypothetical protein [Phycisphaerales bacterium]